MFNAPRRMGGPLSSSAFLSSNPSTTVDPLAQSTPNPGGGFGEVDPWSAVPSPARSSTPRRDSDEAVTSTSPAGLNGDATGNVGLNGLINDPPALYLSLLDSLDPSPSATVPLSAVHRLLSSSGLPASTLERIVHLTARDSSFLSRSEFFAALGLVALAQSNGLAADELSIESLSSQAANLPLPKVSFAEPQLTPAAPETPGLTSPWDTRPSALPEYTSAVESSRDQTDPESGYWKTLERVDVALISEKEGWFLQKYKIESDKRGAGSLSRRYSDFVWLLDCLVKRYPFRLLPSLPPKRIGPDASFLEQRRKGLKRFLNMLVNHPVTRDDGALNVFLTEPNFESWRKRVKVSTEEESTSKKLTQAQEMAIPTDLSQRLTLLREYLPKLLNSYQKLVVLAERSLARLQSEAGDESRIAMALGTISEEMPKCCYKGTPEAGGCSACAGVSRGLSDIGDSWAKAAEENEKRAQSVLLGSIEALKTQRDLYVAFRDLFVRHDKLSKDSVDALLKKVETRQKKVESLKSAQKPGWDVEVDKLVSANDQDTSTISNLRSRRVFIRACMWHELSVVFHSRQNAQVTLGWREFVKDQSEANKAMGRVWEDLTERMTRMPLD